MADVDDTEPTPTDDGRAEKPGDRDRAGKFLPGNPHAFKPGQSGNPGGQPKGVVYISEAYKRHLGAKPGSKLGDTNADRIAQAMIRKAIRGSAPHTAEITDRTEGKAVARIAGADGGPIRVQVLESLTDEQLRDIAAGNPAAGERRAREEGESPDGAEEEGSGTLEP